MAKGKILLEAGTLWTKIKETREQALKCGALYTIPSESELIEQDGVCFLVRTLHNLTRKDEDTRKKGADFNPFLPYEEDLFVADISDTHVCLLNKYNVVDYHLLLITRAFEEQESLLTLEDFAAMWTCMQEFDGLTFYNAGKFAGASQRHKHLQIVPLPLAPTNHKIPIESLFASIQFENSIATIPNFSFIHAFATLDTCKEDSPFAAAEITLKCYYSLLKTVGWENDKQPAAYNLLITRNWMLLVVRSQECFDSIPVNSLGYAGTLAVKNEQQMQILKQHGPMNILKNVAVPISL